MIEDIEIKYSVGALLYSPALNGRVADNIISGRLGEMYSLALCLEDTVSDSSVAAAEAQLYNTIKCIYQAADDASVFIPKIFVRVREPGQMKRLWKSLRPFEDIITGFIAPKYSLDVAVRYNEEICGINGSSGKKLWMMPILESRDIIEPATRHEILGGIRGQINSVGEYILNVRVGGNDFSNHFAARRHCDETIYDILPIAQLFGDILTYFSMDYVVSGPVWEYFSGENDEWKTGLRRELELDRLNGFVGKTVIHPNQIPVVNEMLRVTRKDFEDAKTILSWDSSGLQVGKSIGGERMNEVRTHSRWAQKIMLLAGIYGVD